jgi:AraC-like DNA-binding protein
VNALTGTNRFVPWDGGCLFIGRHLGVVPMHAHYAIQIVFGSEPGVRLRTSDREPWSSHTGAIIASRQPHSMDASDVPENVVLFVEPETREGRALAESYVRRGLVPIAAETLAESRDALFASWRSGAGTREIADAAWGVLHALTGGVEPSVVSDERILRAVAYIKAHVGEPLTLEEVAAQAYLSPSRFRHLFVEETGMALRPYILWRRFLRVWELVMAGQSLSAAAHAAGFADAAHLTRTSRRMFGLAPSVIQAGGPGARADAGADAPDEDG